VVTLIGANGAGKSTTLRAVTGLLAPKSGKILFEGKDITGLPAHQLVARGISMSPEGRGVFANLTVLENLEMGGYLTKDSAALKKQLERGFSLFPRLRERIKQRAGTLSGGEQQMLAMARALMSRPKLLLLDEPSLGLAPIMCQTIFSTIDEIKKEGTTVLLVEQNASAALRHSDRGYVLETGAVILEGTSAAVATDRRVREAYLGE
jgi:branched-chain amino acid transport system ATP-binding protein